MPPTNIVVVTITARPEPEARLADMARTLAYAADALRSRAGITWLLVDELERDLGAILPPTGVLPVVRVRPKTSKFRPALPDHNGARNTALAALCVPGGPDYVVFLDDQTVVTKSFGDVVFAAAARGVGYRAVIRFLRDVAVPPAGDIDAHESGGLDFVACSATSVAGGCFGAPAKALLAADGFDEAYSGQYGREDVECFVRLERAGLQWQTCKRAAALQLGTGAAGDAASRADVTADRDAIQGKRNKVLFKKLLGDRKRTTPEIGLGALGGWTPSWEVVRKPDKTSGPVLLAEGVYDLSKASSSELEQVPTPIPASTLVLSGRDFVVNPIVTTFGGAPVPNAVASMTPDGLVITVAAQAPTSITAPPEPEVPAVDLDDLLDLVP